MNVRAAEIDLRAMTNGQQAAWAIGDFSQLARQVVTVSEQLCVAVDPRPTQRVLDIACGSGNAALVAARRYCNVTGVDFVPKQIEFARRRAAAERLEVEFQVQDAQALPFADASFDVILSVFGVMFAPDQKRAAAELLRVCRPGGKIGLANWISDGMSGDFFKVHVKHMPLSAGLSPAGRWATELGIAELLGRGTRSTTTSRRTFYMYFCSIDHIIEAFRTNFGLTNSAFTHLGSRGQELLRRDLKHMFERYNRATDGTVVMECGYLQVVATRC